MEVYDENDIEDFDDYLAYYGFDFDENVDGSDDMFLDDDDAEINELYF